MGWKFVWIDSEKPESLRFPKWEPFKSKLRKFREGGLNQMERKFTVIFENLGISRYNEVSSFRKIPEVSNPFTLEIQLRSKLSEASLVPNNRVTKLELTVFLRKNCVWLLCSFSSEGCPFSFSTMNWIYGSLRVWEWGVKSFSILLHYISAAFFQRKIAFTNHELRHRLSQRS